MAFADLFLDRRTKEQIFSILPVIKTSVLMFFCPIQKPDFSSVHSINLSVLLFFCLI